MATPVEQVRLLIQDTLVVPDQIFTDADLQVFLDLETSVKSAAALALETIAADKAKLAQKLRTLNFEEDDRGAAQALLNAAQQFRDSDIAFGAAEVAWDDAQAVEIVIARGLREQT